MLTSSHKDQRVTSAHALLYHFHREQDTFFSHITSDKTWTSFVNVKLKQSTQWRHSKLKKSSKPSLKRKSWQLCSMTKMMGLWLTSRSMEQHLLNCAVPFNTNDGDCCGQELFSFTITNIIHDGCPHNWKIESAH